MLNKIDFNNKIKIGNREISEGSPVFVIAEAGVNHGGNMELAFKLIDIAAEAGADAVKFQAFRTESLILENVEKAEYQKNTTSNKESQFDMLKKLELSRKQYADLKEYCRKKEILFLITPFDEQSLTELEDLGVEAYKIASTDATNLPFLKKVAQTGKPVFFSTGMCYIEEVDAAVTEMGSINKNIVLLQCTANYPIADSEANLNVITTFKNRYAILTGYSDHTVGIGAAPYAIPLGARVLEKHFTIDKSMEGPDHLASLSPQELKDFIIQVRQVEKFIGGFEKKPTQSELGTRKSLQKCLGAAKEIKAGEVFTEENIIAKRTGGVGISPLRYKEIIGKAAKADIKANEVIKE
jgi:N,N'-diacetyllegionaminate synthase